MKKYIGVKLVQAEPFTYSEYSNLCGKPYDLERESQEGYMVKYSDDYISWSPKEVFEKAYMQIGDNDTIVETNVNNFVDKIEFDAWGDETTIAVATLKNGFIITESSSCVDPANFSMDIGSSVCKDRIYDRVWHLLGFLLQTAKNGIK